MIKVKPPEEFEIKEADSKDIEKYSDLVMEQINDLMLTPTARYLKEISKTLKDILKEMRKSKL